MIFNQKIQNVTHHITLNDVTRMGLVHDVGYLVDAMIELYS